MRKGDGVRLPPATAARSRTRTLPWVWVAAGWIEDRVDDLYSWAIALLGRLPRRCQRLGDSFIEAGRGIAHLARGKVRRVGMETPHAGYSGAGEWAGILILRLLDLVSLTEIVEIVIRAFTIAKPLTAPETVVMQSVLGRTAIRYTAVRVCTSGILRPILALNGGRAFAIAHTICMPESGSRARDQAPILLHEMVHVLQYERAGSAYIVEALRAQRTEGYDYGGPAGLLRGAVSGKRYQDFNREQQAQIVQDYFVRRQCGEDVKVYDPYLSEMRRGEL